jgi:hypothetical protein
MAVHTANLGLGLHPLKAILQVPLSKILNDTTVLDLKVIRASIPNTRLKRH